MQILAKVRPQNEKVVALDMELDDTIGKLKAKIAERVGIPADKQSLWRACRECEDGCTIGSYLKLETVSPYFEVLTPNAEAAESKRRFEKNDYIIGVESTETDESIVPDGYLGDDTNKGQKGKYVYVKPVYGPRSQACEGFEFVSCESQVTSLPNHSTGDLAKGAGGNYRYIKPVFGGYGGYKVKKVWWSESKATYCTEDINKGRGGRYLYFCWSY